MAVTINKIKGNALSAIVAPGRHGDGGGLYLNVKDTGSRSWMFVYRQKQPNGKPSKTVELGLGSFLPVNAPKGASIQYVTLEQARRLAEKCRDWLAEGKDPKAERAAALAFAAAAATAPVIPTFGEFVDGWIAETVVPDLKNPKHIQQWKNTMSDKYIADLRKIRIDLVTDDDVIAAVKPHGERARETAVRILGRIGKALTEAKARKLRTGDNPAAWDLVKGRLAFGSKKVVKHHNAIAYRSIAPFMTALRARTGVAARCLEFTILTAARSGEAFGAVWSEFDLDAATWTVPAQRMKMDIEHTVPLSDAALAVLRQMRPEYARRGDYVFPGAKKGKPLSNMAMDMQIRRMEQDGYCGDITVHGMRSAFRDWAGNQTDYPRELCEEALAHAVGNKVERAYKREQAIEKRRPMMRDWAAYCDEAANNVVSLVTRRA